MPLPHEQARIDAATGWRREKLVEAAAVLDRIRADNPGVEYIRDMPEGVRSTVRQALRTLGGPAGFGFSELVIVAFLAAGFTAAWHAPMRVFRCAPQSPGLAQCVVADRMFGVVPRGEQLVAGIAKTEVHGFQVEHQSFDGGVRRTTSTGYEQGMSLFDAGGRKLWSASEEYLIGAPFAEVGASIDAIVSGASAQPVLRIQAYWPTLFLPSACFLVFFSALMRELGLMIRERGLIPESVYRLVFVWGAFLLAVAFCGLAVAMALLGSDPPAWMAAVVGLG